MLTAEREVVLSLLSADAVRERAHEIFQQGIDGRLAHFSVNLDKLLWTADYVAQVIWTNYPHLNIPLHSRWRHFVFGARDFWAERRSATNWSNAAGQNRAAFDLALISVLLDAGAGSKWRYRDPVTGLIVTRSEGLALASLRTFEAGLFSSEPRDLLRVDGERLATLHEQELANAFQVSRRNPLNGLNNRAALLRNLGKHVCETPDVFALQDRPRPGGLFDWLANTDTSITAPRILRALLVHLGPIWPDRMMHADIPLGDTWRHSGIRRNDASDGLMPLHKLSQWLSYSLIEPLQQAGFAVTEIDRLTGLAEYRNGGLMIDTGVLHLRDPTNFEKVTPVNSELVVEWRALTVALLDALLPLVRERLGVSERDFSLGGLLQGGTWAAGRKIAYTKRPSGAPPLTVLSDGTVF